MRPSQLPRVLFFLLIWSLLQSFCSAQLPAGFTAQEVAHIEDATSISHVPTSTDGVERLLATSKNGKLFLVTITENLPGSTTDLPTVQVQQIADFGSTVCVKREQGLSAAVAHPLFDTTHPYVYVSYTDKADTDCVESPTTGPRHKCARFDYDAAAGQLDRNTELVLFVTPRMYRGVHTGGSMAFGNDGFLYITAGDAGGRTEAVAQDPTNLLGTVVRLRDDGSIPDSNPYAATGERCGDNGSSDGGGVCREMFAWGLRNPNKLTMNPNSDAVRFWISDVGHNTWESINESGAGYAGANYGYPVREGPCNGMQDPLNNCALQNDFQDPVYWYVHPSGGGCIIGSAISKAELWPQNYDQVFFGDYQTGEIYMITPDANNECLDCSQPRPAYQRTTFHTDAPSIVDLRFVPFRNNQALYYLMRVGDSSLRRVVYVGGSNVSPVAVIETNLPSGTGTSGTDIEFDGSGSYDGNGDSLTYQWDFGDGQSSTLAVATHAYSQDGRYTVSLEVSDGQLTSLPDSEEIQIGVPPVIAILNPPAGQLFAVGDIYTLTGEASSKGVPLDVSSMTWEVRQVHGDHYHPFLTPQTGNNIELSPAFEPEDFLAATNSFLRILLTATDSDGLETTVTRDVLPVQHTIDFRTEPSGISIEVDGFVLTTPSSGVSWENYQLLLSAPDTGRYSFEKWSTGELLAQTHSITVTANLQTVTAFYNDKCECTGSFFWCFFHLLFRQLPCRISAWFKDTADPLKAIICAIPFIGRFLCPFLP